MNSAKQSPNPLSLGLSLATVPLLLGLLVASTLRDSLREIGQASEEIFRGDRLPILNFSPQNQES